MDAESQGKGWAEVSEWKWKTKAHLRNSESFLGRQKGVYEKANNYNV